MINTILGNTSPMWIATLLVLIATMYKVLRYLTCREVKRIDNDIKTFNTKITEIEQKESNCRDRLNVRFIDTHLCEKNVARIEKSVDLAVKKFDKLNDEISKHYAEINRELGSINGQLKRMNGKD